MFFNVFGVQRPPKTASRGSQGSRTAAQELQNLKKNTSQNQLIVGIVFLPILGPILVPKSDPKTDPKMEPFFGPLGTPFWAPPKMSTTCHNSRD